MDFVYFPSLDERFYWRLKQHFYAPRLKQLFRRDILSSNQGCSVHALTISFRVHMSAGNSNTHLKLSTLKTGVPLSKFNCQAERSAF